MNPHADHVKPLAPVLQKRLEQGLQLFKQNWTETLMAETLGQMTADHPLRYPSTVEMTWLDLRQRWKQGQRITIEEYLAAYPELGSVHTVSVDLIRWEYKVRKANGDRVEVEEYARRFPNQYEEFLQRTRYAEKGEADKARPASAKAPSPSPVAAAFGAPSPVAAAFGAPSPVAAAFGAPAAVPIPGKTRPVRPALAAAAASTGPKRRARWPWLVGASFLLLLAAFLGWRYKDVFRHPNTLQAGNEVQSLTVKLDVGAGEAVQEPIYLDLGLGFPLWLVSGGSPPPVLFGAVPQQTTASGQLPANSSTTFKFLAAGAPGQDVLTTTPQLLSGVKVGDIRRVGFASLAQQDWELAGFEIQVNGQTFHSAKGLKIRPKQLQEEALKKLGALNQKGAPADQERADLRDLIQTGLASDSEKARLKEIEQQTPTGPATAEKTRLERQLRGQSPWYVETVPPAPASAATAAGAGNLFDLLTPRAHAAAPAATSVPRSVRVTVVTAAHDKSNTSNYVYVLAGSHKYLIGGPQFPLTSANGPQAFDLDLMAGPLEPSDLSGWGLGMLAPPVPRGKDPERWHPRRVQVEVDGKTVYDSEENAADRQTLAAIRLVPPRQLDLDGTVVKNPSNSRELYVWHAGKATGFDPGTGAVDPLPPGIMTGNGNKVPSDPTDPSPPLNPNKPIDLNKVLDLNIPSDPIDPKKALDPLVPPDLAPGVDPPIPPSPPPNPNPNKDGFPGETPQVVPFNPATPPAPVVPPPPQVVIVGPIIIQIPALDPGLTPTPNSGTKPAGKPLQIDAVNFVQLSRGGPGSCIVHVTWKIPSDADESGVDHYDVSLVGLENDLSSIGLTPRNGQLSLSLGRIPKGIFSLTRIIPDRFILDWRFVLPVVRPVLTDPKATAQIKLGPARSTAKLQAAHVNATLAGLQQIQGPNLVVNVSSRFKTHTAFDMFVPENAALVVPLDAQKPEVRLSLTASDLQVGAAPATIRFYTGFSGGKAEDNKMEYRVEAFATEAPASAGAATTTIALNDVSVPNQTVNTAGFFTIDGSQGSMHQVSVTIPATVISRIKSSTRRWIIELTISMRNFKGDDTRPPVVFDATILNK